MAAFNGFSHAMQEHRLFEAIISVMGFAYVMKLTQCDQHLIQALVRPLRKAGTLIIPGAVLVTFFINTSITSSAGCSAAVGAILIPIDAGDRRSSRHRRRRHLRRHLWRDFQSRYAQVALVAEVAKASNMEVVTNHFVAMLAAGVIGAFTLYLVAIVFKEAKGYVLPEDRQIADDFKVNYRRGRSAHSAPCCSSSATSASCRSSSNWRSRTP